MCFREMNSLRNLCFNKLTIGYLVKEFSRFWLMQEFDWFADLKNSSVIALCVYKTNTQPVGITDRLMCEACRNYRQVEVWGKLLLFLDSECNKIDIHVLKSNDVFCHLHHAAPRATISKTHIVSFLYKKIKIYMSMLVILIIKQIYLYPHPEKDVLSQPKWAATRAWHNFVVAYNTKC